MSSASRAPNTQAADGGRREHGGDGNRRGGEGLDEVLPAYLHVCMCVSVSLSMGRCVYSSIHPAVTLSLRPSICASMRIMIHVYVQADDEFHFTIVNMKKSDSLYNYGLKPLVCRSEMGMHFGIHVARRTCTVSP